MRIDDTPEHKYILIDTSVKPSYAFISSATLTEYEAQTKNRSSSMKEFESLLNEDFKDRKLKENQIIKATITEITKNFIVVDCKAKMEGMIPIDEFQTNKEIDKIKVGSKVDVYLERIESLRNGEIVISREKARRVTAWKKMQKFFESQEELTGYITGKVKGGFICTVDGLPTFMPASQISDKPLKKNDLDQLMNTPTVSYTHLTLPTKA